VIRLRRPAEQPPREAIAPLIDAAFFLLVFALLAGRMDATAPFEVLPPVSQEGAPLPQGGATISVSADGALALDGRPREAAEIVAALGRAAPDGPADFVRINADGAAPLHRVLPLLAALEDAGAARVALVVTPTPP
jgi:biopolymer transport protein ExbD